MTNSSDNILNKNFSFSRVLKNIDSSLKFDKMQEGRTLFVLNKMKREERRKMLLFQKKYNHREILYNLKRAYDDNKLLLEKSYNKEMHKHSEMLPKLINSNINNDKSMIERNTKNMNNINEKNNKNNNSNKTGIFENDWKKEFLKKNNKKIIKKVSPNIMVDDEDNNEDIFRKGYKEEKPKLLEKIKIFARIKANNLKVIKKLKNFRNIKEKFSEKKEYSPNYSVLEKHVPEIRLDTKSKRLFPDKFIKMHNYSNDKEIFIKRLFRNNSLKNDNKNNYSINPCSLIRKETSFRPINNDITIHKVFSKSKNSKENINNSMNKEVLSRNSSSVSLFPK